MAASLSGEYTVIGNKRAYFGTLTLDADTVTATVKIPGMRKIDAAVVTPVSGATNSISLHYNLGSANTAINGELGITSALSGNVFGVLVFGD